MFSYPGLFLLYRLYLECSPDPSSVGSAKLCSTHVIVSCGRVLVARCFVATSGAVVSVTNIISVRPAVAVGVFVRPFVVVSTGVVTLIPIASHWCSLLILGCQDGFIFLPHVRQLFE